MSNAIPETSVTFFPGGHDHDGNGSNLIETTAYSIYDWNVGYTGTGSRLVRQQDNFESLKVVVTQMVTDAILTPSGVRLSPNNVRAVHIQANSIGAEKLEANLVLVNNVIKSNNFNGTINANNQITSQGSAGWAITSSGDAVFSNTAIRGGLTAEAVYVGANNYWYSNGAFSLGGSVGITKTASGDVTIGSDVVINGNISAANLTDGTLTSTPGGNDIDLNFGSGKFTVDSDGNVFANNAEFTGNVTFGGELDGPSGRIGGWYIDGNNLQNLSATTILAPDGTIDIGGDLNATGNVESGSDMNASGYITANERLGQNDATSASGSFTNIVRDDGNGQLYIESSKRELKKDIEYYTNGIEKIKLLKPVSFRWKDWRYGDADIEEMFLTNKHYGFIADDVAEVLPNFAQWTTKTSPPSVQMWDNQAITSVSVAAIKELITKVETMEQRIQELENGV